MNHARVSPNGQWVTFSRFNNIVEDGCAVEGTGNYANTEIVLLKIDGSVVKTLVGPKPKEIAVNSYWVTDNTLLYFGWKAGTPSGGIYKLYLDENMEVIKEERLNTPENVRATDPHQVGNKVVFPGTALASVYNLYGHSFPEKGSIRGIWIMNEDGSEAKPLTIPRYPNGSVVFFKGIGGGSTGDNDPKLSPDGTKVAFMRRTLHKIGEQDVHNWHTYIVDVNNPLSEVDISAQHFTGPLALGYADPLPEWIDNENLLVWHINAIDKKYEVHKMKVDGSERQKIPLPEGYDYVMPSSFSGNKIIFSATKTKD